MLFRSLLESTPPLSLAEIKSRTKEFTYNQWQFEWDNCPDCFHTWRMIPKVKSNISKAICGLKRDWAKYFLQMLTGHCKFRKHQWNILGKKKHLDPTCPYCGQESKLDDTPAHALKECDRWIPERRHIFNEDHIQHVEDYHRLEAFFDRPGLRNHPTTHLSKSWRLATVGVMCKNLNKVK